MTRDHYDESFFFRSSSFYRLSIASKSPHFLDFLFSSSSIFHRRAGISFTIQVFSVIFIPLLSPLSLFLSLSLDVSLLLTSSRGRDSRLINAWNEILKERVLCLNIAPIRRGVWLLFFTERSVQTCQRGCQREKRT